MQLSLIVPVYNAGSFVEESITRLRDFLKANCESFEIVAVNDGSTDDSLLKLSRLNQQDLKIVTFEKNRGKFAAIGAGMVQAQGQCRIFTDADSPYDFEAIPFICSLISERGFHVVVGDRTLPGSEYAIHIGTLRAFCTRLFTWFIRLFVTGGLFDTQCGLKGFRGDVADALFPLLRESGFAGDVELLYLALKWNLDIKRIPVRLRRTGPSTVRIFRHGWRMIWRLMLLPWQWRLGVYRSEVLSRISNQVYWERPRF